MKYFVLVIFGIGCGCTQQPPAESAEARRDLAAIVMHYHLFVGINEVAPASRDELLSFRDPYESLPGNARSSEQCRVALQSDDYVVIWSFDLAENVSENDTLILAYHKDTPEHGGYVAFADGIARILTAEEFANTPKAEPQDSEE